MAIRPTLPVVGGYPRGIHNLSQRSSAPFVLEELYV